MSFLDPKRSFVGVANLRSRRGALNSTGFGHRSGFTCKSAINIAGSTGELSDPTVVNPSFFADKSGTYNASLMVNDGFTNSVVDDVSIIVVVPPPVVSITAPEDGSVVAESPVTLTGTVDDPLAT